MILHDTSMRTSISVTHSCQSIAARFFSLSGTCKLYNGMSVGPEAANVWLKHCYLVLHVFAVKRDLCFFIILATSRSHWDPLMLPYISPMLD